MFVADLTHPPSLGLADRSRLCALSHFIPVLLLVDDPVLADLARTDAGSCSILFEPFGDLDRLLSRAIELGQHTPPFNTPALSAFF